MRLTKKVKILFPLAFLVPPLQLAVAFYLFLLFLVVASYVVELREGTVQELLDPSRISSLIVKDRDGRILRDSPSIWGGTRAKWVKLEEISLHFLRAVIAAEDQRFYLHSGVDLLAVARALFQNITSGRIVSGGSTITQQLVKMATGGGGPRSKRTLWRKFYEMAGAIFVERYKGKDEILETYANWVVFGNMTRGVEAAARFYFGKPAAHLTLGEGAALAALLRAPSALNPKRGRERLEERRRWVLGRMLKQGMIGREEYEYACTHPPNYLHPTSPFLAPHLVDEVLERWGQEKLVAGEIETTIDGVLQAEVENLAAKMIEKVRHLDITNAAVIVIDNATGEILAWVGSSAYFDASREGMNDGVTARRSPGSALKPFIYLAAFEKGSSPARVIADVDTSFRTAIGAYKPRNYDGLAHGPVRMRTALGSSYNVPAVKLVAELSPGAVLSFLRKVGFKSLDKTPDYYGVAIALGDGEVTLLELASAYSALARGGVWIEPTLIRRVKDASGRDVELALPERRTVASPVTSWLVTDILSDAGARAPAFGRAEVFRFPWQVAVKTGTSNDYRDNWTLGYSSEVTVGVWVGNFSGKPMGNVSGITGAGPLFRQVMLAAMRGREGKPFPPPPGVVTRKVCSLSGELPGEHCRQTYEEKFIEGTEPKKNCSWHVAGVDGKARVRWPDELAGWALETGNYDPLAYAAHEGGSATLGTANSGSSSFPEESPSAAPLPPKILFPADGELLVIDPDVPAFLQALNIEVQADPAEKSVTLHVNGKPFATKSRPFVFRWPLVEGTHTFSASGSASGSGKPITVIIR